MRLILCIETWAHKFSPPSERCLFSIIQQIALYVGNKYTVGFSLKQMRKDVSSCLDSVPIIMDDDGCSWTLFHSLHSFYRPQVGKSIIQIYVQSDRTVLIQLLKVKLMEHGKYILINATLMFVWAMKWGVGEFSV